MNRGRAQRARWRTAMRRMPRIRGWLSRTDRSIGIASSLVLIGARVSVRRVGRRVSSAGDAWMRLVGLPPRSGRRAPFDARHRGAVSRAPKGGGFVTCVLAHDVLDGPDGGVEDQGATSSVPRTMSVPVVCPSAAGVMRPRRRPSAHPAGLCVDHAVSFSVSVSVSVSVSKSKSKSQPQPQPQSTSRAPDPARAPRHRPPARAAASASSAACTRCWAFCTR
jgi:hypothetical protein